LTLSARQRATPEQRHSRAGWYEPLDWVLVRSPLLPFRRYLELEDDRAAELPAALEEPRVRRALSVSSPGLFERLASEPSSTSSGRRRRLGALRYLIRMATRPTPYGLNAGVALGRWGERTDLELADGDAVRTRLDMGLIANLVAALEGRIEVVRELSLETHPLVAIRAGRAFLPERFDEEGGAVQVSVRATRPAVRALMLADGEPMPFAEVAETLEAEFPKAGRQRVEELLHTLVREGLILTELRPPLTNGDPIRRLLDVLEPIDAAGPECERLADAVAACQRWDELGYEEGAERFAALLDKARAVATPPDRIPPVRVDMRRELAADAIHRAVAEETARAAELLLRLSPLATGAASLNKYRDRFIERYGPDTEVPLLELVDPETGLGLVDLLPDYRSAGPVDDDARRRDRRLLALASGALKDGALSVELDADTIAELDTGPDENELNPTLELAVYVAAASRDELDDGRFQVIVSPMLGSYAAGRILGRFAYLFGEPAERALREAAVRDDHQRGLPAELVYQPERPWLNNVMVRPAVREHEIPVGAAPGVGRDRVIPAEELLVGVSGDSFRLRWPAGGTYVDVCEGHMLNPKAAPAVAAFLALMRNAGRPVLAPFMWGSARALPRLPRVESGHVVLAPASWHPPFGEAGLEAGDRARFAEVLRTWGAEWLLPRRVFAGQGDQRLLIDLEDPDQVDLLRGLVAGRKGDAEVVLQEALPGADAAWLPGPGGGFLVELAVPLARRQGEAAQQRAAHERAAGDAPPPAAQAPPARAARTRPPGSDWLYAKLYTGGNTAAHLVGNGLREFGAEALAGGLAEDWFFIRYKDDQGPHLRVRFRGEPATLSARLGPRLYGWAAELIDQGACRSLALDTYERELERYGGEHAMEVAEAIFGVDSRLVAGVIGLDLKTAGAAVLPVLTLERLLIGLGLDAAARLDWCSTRRGARHEVVEEWREHKDALRALLGSPGGAHSLGGDQLAALLDGFVTDLRPLGERLNELRAEGTLSWPAADALHASFAHMHCNRLLGIDRPAERRSVGLLHRALDSLARAPVAPAPA
jgi:class I lanthipeptide synthase